jgi:WD40 repeat protein
VTAWNTTSWRATTAGTNAFAGAGSFRACSLDGRVVATSISENGAELVQVWDAARQRMLGEVRCPIEQPTSWAVSSDGRLVAAGDWKGEIKLWELAGSRELTRWTAHTSPVWSLSFSPDAAMLASAGFDQVVQLWAVTNQVRIATLRGHFNEVWCVAFSPDGRRLATGSKDGTAKSWRPETSQQEVTLSNALPPLVFLGNSKHLIAAKSERVLAAWDVESRVELGNLPVFDLGGAEATTPGANPDYVAVAILPGLFQLLARRDPPGTRTFVNVGDHATPVVVSPDKRWLARVDRGGIKVVELASVRSVLLSNASAPMAFGPDSQRFVTTGTNYSADIWQISTAASRTNENEAIHLDHVATLRGHKWSIAAVCFSPDGRLLVTASTDGTARLWSAHSGELVATLNGHKEGLTCAAFSPDGRTLATGSTDDTVKLWSVTTGQELVTLTEFGEDIGALAFSPDGQALAVGCLPGTGGHRWVQVWRAPSQATIDADLAAVTPTRPRSASTGNR